MNDLNKNFEIESGFIMSINMKYTNSSKEFALNILEAIYIGLNENKDKLFSCNNDCIDSCTLVVELFSDKVINSFFEKYSFKYSLKTGFYPFDLIEQFYPKFQVFQEVSILVQVNQICQE